LYKAWIGSTDFHVYWQAAQDWTGAVRSPYYFDASTKGFVFKYPPWILPLFTPLGYLSYDISKMAWAVLELLCLLYAVKKVIQFGVRKELTFLVALSLWFIWQDHFWSGQFTLLLLAAGLWIMPPNSFNARQAYRMQSSPRDALKIAITGYLFTAKIFSVLTFLGSWRKFLNPRVIVFLIIFFATPTLLVWEVMRFQDPTVSLIGVFEQFSAAAKSGGAELGAQVVRGQLNHGLTAAILRWFNVDSTKAYCDVGVCLGLTAVLGLIWNHFEKHLSIPEFLSGWLALALITHPLAWDHSFVLAFPLCALSLEQAVRSKRMLLITLSFLGCVCIGILVPNIVGTEAVKPLEYIAIKSWGVILSAVALVLARRLLAGSKVISSPSP
jgi:hypothetical protein